MSFANQGPKSEDIPHQGKNIWKTSYTEDDPASHAPIHVETKEALPEVIFNTLCEKTNIDAYLSSPAIQEGDTAWGKATVVLNTGGPSITISGIEIETAPSDFKKHFQAELTRVLESKNLENYPYTITELDFSLYILDGSKKAIPREEREAKASVSGPIIF